MPIKDGKVTAEGLRSTAAVEFGGSTVWLQADEDYEQSNQRHNGLSRRAQTIWNKDRQYASAIVRS